MQLDINTPTTALAEQARCHIERPWLGAGPWGVETGRPGPQGRVLRERVFVVEPQYAGNAPESAWVLGGEPRPVR